MESASVYFACFHGYGSVLNRDSAVCTPEHDSVCSNIVFVALLLDPNSEIFRLITSEQNHVGNMKLRVLDSVCCAALTAKVQVGLAATTQNVILHFIVIIFTTTLFRYLGRMETSNLAL